MSSLKIGNGSTISGNTAWQQYPGGKGVFVKVDTTGAGFKTTPTYFTSIGGDSSHWATTGATSIYAPTPTSFDVYVRWADGAALTPAQANGFKWHINWLGVEK